MMDTLWGARTVFRWPDGGSARMWRWRCVCLACRVVMLQWSDWPSVGSMKGTVVWRAAQRRRSEYRLTQYAHGGGCACKIPPGEVEEVVAGVGAAAEAGG